MYKTWDARAVAALKKYGLRESSSGSVRTTSSKHQEIALVFMPNFGGVGKAGYDRMSVEERHACPDIDLDDATIWYPIWRPECIGIMKLLPNIRPGVLYIVGSASGASRPEVCAQRLATTGTGIGGSGGQRLGRVKQVVVEKGSHMIAMDRHMAQVVKSVGEWLRQEMEGWRAREEVLKNGWRAKTTEERASVDPMLLAAFAEWEPKKNLVEILKPKL